MAKSMKARSTYAQEIQQKMVDLRKTSHWPGKKTARQRRSKKS